MQRQTQNVREINHVVSVPGIVDGGTMLLVASRLGSPQNNFYVRVLWWFNVDMDRVPECSHRVKMGCVA
jgi:hypothetical protein